jgi:SAM-dependent methyltransferase
MGTRVEQKLYPEILAGGYSRFDHRMEYILRVNAILRPEMTILDFGAGRGKWDEDPVVLRRDLGNFRGRCAKVVACDIDPVVRNNPQADDRIVIAPRGALPFADASFDLISAFSVFEHIEHAEAIAGELSRILKPGGWICAWTPNKWGYVGVGARIIPGSLHKTVLRLLDPQREEGDSFPPLYRMNTRSKLHHLFPETKFSDLSYTYDGIPFYHGNHLSIARFWQLSSWLTPPAFKAFYMIFLQKRYGSAVDSRLG